MSQLDPLSRAVAAAVYWRMRYQDAEPDVGMGPFPESVLRDTLLDLDLQPYQVNEQAILTWVKAARR